MLSAIRTRMSFANVLATLALFFALSGGAAYAASHYLVTSTKQISPKVLKSLKGAAGKTGPAGASGPAGPTGPAGAVGPAGAQGPAGPTGAAGSPGAAGAKGATGATGPAGPAGVSGFTKTLPSGETETGMWDVSVFGDVDTAFPAAIGSISFPIPMPSVGESFTFTVAQTENEEFGTSGCKGVIEGVPTAPKGVLCLYTTNEELQNATGTLVAAEPGFEHGFDKSGAVLGGIFLEGSPSAPARASYDGKWAVTAP